MRHQRKVVISAAMLALGLVMAGCSSSNGSTSGQQLENQQQSNDTTTYEQAQPIPHFSFSQYRATLTEVEAIQALGTQTTSFFFNLGVQKPIFSCPSLGMPVASTAQLSNPQQIENDSYPQGGTSLVIGQMDPNGVYSPSDSTGTDVLCEDSSGQPYIQYWEGYVDAVSGAARWDRAANSVVVIGQPTVPKCHAEIVKRKAEEVCTKA